MKLNDFEVLIPEGNETEEGYVCLKHGTQYSIKLRNHSEHLRCNATVKIDGRSVGAWRVDQSDAITIERPVHDFGRFTFYQEGTPEAAKANIRLNDELGLISVLFRPEKRKDGASVLYMAGPRPYAAGGTGLSGKSAQRFDEAEEIETDDEKAVTIHLRLVAIQNEPRPLFALETPVPHAVQTKTEDLSKSDGCSPSKQRQPRSPHASTLTALGACMLILSIAYLLLPMWKTNDHATIDPETVPKAANHLPTPQSVSQNPAVHPEEVFRKAKATNKADQQLEGKPIELNVDQRNLPMLENGRDKLVEEQSRSTGENDAGAQNSVRPASGSNGHIESCSCSLCVPSSLNPSSGHRVLHDWSSSDGKVIRAYFIDLQDNGVVIEVPSTGIKHVVPLSRLSVQSQEQAKANKVAAGKNSKLEKEPKGLQAAGPAS